MPVNPVSVPVVNAALENERLLAVEENGVNQLPEAGQTSEAGPAVVTDISAAALETSRAVDSSAQAADQSTVEDVPEAEARGRSAAQEVATQPYQDYQKSRLDIVV